MSTMYHCATCNKETNYAIAASTSCSGCKKNFCCVFCSDCFAQHYDKCENPYAQTITNPQWKVNLFKVNTDVPMPVELDRIVS